MLPPFVWGAFTPRAVHLWADHPRCVNTAIISDFVALLSLRKKVQKGICINKDSAARNNPLLNTCKNVILVKSTISQLWNIRRRLVCWGRWGSSLYTCMKLNGSWNAEGYRLGSSHWFTFIWHMLLHPKKVHLGARARYLECIRCV